MTMPHGGDLTLLGFVREEIDRALTTVSDRLAGEPDVASVAAVSEELHRITGAVGMAGLDGVIRYTDAMEKLVARLRTDSGFSGDRAAVAELLRNAAASLRAYLAGLSSGRPDRPLRLLPQYAALRQALGDDKVPASDLFWPDLSKPRPAVSGTGAEGHADPETTIRTARARYQRGMLAWLRGDARGLKYMQDAMAPMDQLHGHTTPLFWIADAFFDALMNGGVEADSLLKKLCARLDIQLARMGDGSPSIANGLVRDVLYHVATSSVSSPAIDRIREHYDLNAYLRDAAPLQPDNLIVRLRNAWEALSGHDSPDLTVLAADIDALRTGADDLRALVADTLDAVIGQVSAVGGSVSPAVRMSVAQLLLIADPIRDSDGGAEVRYEAVDPKALRWAVENVLATLKGAPSAAMPEDDNAGRPAASVLGPLTVEVVASIKRIEHALTTFIAQPQQSAEAQIALNTFTQLNAMLQVAQLDDAAALLQRCRDFVAGWLDDRDAVGSTLPQVAEALASTEAYMLALRAGQLDATAVLDPVLERFGLSRPAPLPTEADETVGPQSVEEELAEKCSATQTFFNEIVDQYADSLKRLEDNLRSVHEDSRLTADREREQQAAAALAVVHKLNAESTSDLTPLIKALAEPAEAPAPAPPAQFDVGADPEILEVFLEEATEVLQTIAENAALLRQNSRNLEAFVVVRRAFHTLKGSSRMAGLTHMGDVAWRYEELLNHFLAENRSPDAALLDGIDAARARFATWIVTLKGSPSVAIEAGDLLEQVQRIRHGDAAAPRATTPATDARPADDPRESTTAAADTDATVVAESVAAAETAATVAASATIDAGTQAETPAANPAAPAREMVTLGDALTVSRTLYEIFLQEANGHVSSLQHAYTIPSTTAPVAHSAVRAAHTLAGISRTVGIGALAELCYALERLLLVRHDAGSAILARESTLVRDTVARIADMVETVRRQMLPDPAETLILSLIAAREFDPDQARGDAGRPQRLAPGATIGSDDLAVVDPELRTTFCDEAYELATALARSAQAWRDAPGETRHGDDVARHLHTLKGSARSAGAMSIGELVHETESRVVAAVNGGSVDAALLNELQATFDQWCEAFEAARHLTQPAIVADDVVAAVDGAAEERGEEPKAGATAGSQLRVPVQTLERLLDGAAEFALSRMRIDAELNSARHTAQDMNERVGHLRSQLREIEIQAESQMRARFDGIDRNDVAFDPLEFDRYTRLQELTRLMAESLHDLTTVQYNLTRHFDATGVVLSHQARVQRSLHEDLMHIRTTAFGSISERLQRIARRTCVDLQREVELVISGGQVELDRTVLEKLHAPLEHMVRNAIAHGIEPAAERAAAGKPERGSMTITVRQEANATVIVIGDDGAGLNLERIRRRAESVGLLVPGEAADDDTLRQMIFRPGFSTADKVTEVAGRGVGLDVVQNTISGLGGHIRVDSVAGKGTTFTLTVPLTLAVTQAVLVRNGDQTYGIPATLIAQVQRCTAAEIEVMYAQRHAEWSRERFPFRYLGDLLAVAPRGSVLKRNNIVLMLRAGDQRLAVHVDDLLLNQELALKDMGPQLGALPGVAGVTVGHDGQALLILNPLNIAARQTQFQPRPQLVETRTPATALVLVVDDSVTVRKVTGRLLERAGYRVAVAKDGVEAMERIRDERPAIILSDIEMPRMDGFELTRHLRNDSATAQTPIIVISSRTAEKHRVRAQELGVNVFLGKPFNDDVLLRHIDRLIHPETIQRSVA